MKIKPDQNICNHLILASQPFFSIIITTYNRSLLLKRALNSLISQTESDWEAIIIDDGSTDDTHLQVLPYLRSYAKIKYIKKVHSGEAMSKNEGLRLSAGKFISFLDSDDEYAPEHLATRKDILVQNPAVMFLHGGVKIMGNQYVPDRFNHAKRISLNSCVIGGTFFIERNILLSLNGFRNILLGPDADLFDRAKELKINMLKTNLPTYIYHHDTEDSITNRIYLDNQEYKKRSNSDRLSNNIS